MFLNDCFCFAVVAYFPASGYRTRDTGALASIGSEVLCRSASSFGVGSTQGTTLDLLSYSVGPVTRSRRANTSPVRCVQELIK